jgi:hypothetical protein
MTQTHDDHYIDNPNAKVTFRKADSRYYVSIDGVKVGWVLNWNDGKGWSMWSTVRDSIKGERMATGYKTRRDAVMEGLSNLRIWHGGGVMILNMETVQDELFVFSTATLQAITDRLLDEKYPMS